MQSRICLAVESQVKAMRYFHLQAQENEFLQSETIGSKYKPQVSTNGLFLQGSQGERGKKKEGKGVLAIYW